MKDITKVVRLIRRAVLILQQARHLGRSIELTPEERTAVKIATDAVALENKKLLMDVAETEDERYGRLHG